MIGEGEEEEVEEGDGDEGREEERRSLRNCWMDFTYKSGCLT